MKRSTQPIVARAAESPTYSLSESSRFSFPLSGRDGHPEIFVEVSRRGSAAPLHRHAWATWELVVEGRVRFLVDGQEHVLEAGDLIYTPPNAAHGYVVESETARIVGLNDTGSRFEQLQKRAESLFSAPGGPDMDEVVKVAGEAGVTVLGPPLSPSGD